MDHTVTLLFGILAGTFFIRWGFYEEEMPAFLFFALPWRCEEHGWIWPKLFFAAAEFCFIMAFGACIVGMQTGADVLIGESIFLIAGMVFRNMVRFGLLEDDYGEEFIEKVFEPW